VFQTRRSLNPRRARARRGRPALVAQASCRQRHRRPRRRTLARVGLAPDIADRFPRELSGGPAPARANRPCPGAGAADRRVRRADLGLACRFQAQILNRCRTARDLGLTYVFISHNLAVVEHIATESPSCIWADRRTSAGRGLVPGAASSLTKALLASVLTPSQGSACPKSAWRGCARSRRPRPAAGSTHAARSRSDRCGLRRGRCWPWGGGLVACHMAAARQNLARDFGYSNWPRKAWTSSRSGMEVDCLDRPVILGRRWRAQSNSLLGHPLDERSYSALADLGIVG